MVDDYLFDLREKSAGQDGRCMARLDRRRLCRNLCARTLTLSGLELELGEKYELSVFICRW